MTCYFLELSPEEVDHLYWVGSKCQWASYLSSHSPEEGHLRLTSEEYSKLRKSIDEDKEVYGGKFLPFLNPSAPLYVKLKELYEIKKKK